MWMLMLPCIHLIPSALCFKGDILLCSEWSLFSSVHVSALKTKPLIQWSSISHPLLTQRWAQLGLDIHSPRNGSMIYRYQAPVLRPGVLSKTSPADNPIKVVWKSTGADTRDQSDTLSTDRDVLYNDKYTGGQNRVETSSWDICLTIQHLVQYFDLCKINWKKNK